MQSVTSADGTAISFERTGTGPPLVLMHGGAAIDHRWWERGGVRPALAEYAFDPGRFAEMTTPTLLLLGGESPPLFEAVTETIHAALPNSRIASFAGHGHLAMFTATDRFIDQVLAFTREADEDTDE